MSSDTYKRQANSGKYFKEFYRGFFPDKTQTRTSSIWSRQELHAQSAGHYKIIKKIGLNVYMFKLFPDSSISSTFNVSDLTEYREPTIIPSEAFELDSLFESEPNLECPQIA